MGDSQIKYNTQEKHVYTAQPTQRAPRRVGKREKDTVDVNWHPHLLGVTFLPVAESVCVTRMLYIQPYSQIHKDKGKISPTSCMDTVEIFSGEGGWSPPLLLTQIFEMLVYFQEGWIRRRHLAAHLALSESCFQSQTAVLILWHSLWRRCCIWYWPQIIVSSSESRPCQYWKYEKHP